MNSIAVQNLTKQFGSFTAVDNISFDVKKGEIFGFLGANGAGKTTLVKILLGLVAPTSGQAWLLDSPVGTAKVREKVGYLPEDHRLPEYHTGPNLLDFYGALQGVPGPVRARRIPELLGQLGLAGRERLKVRGYSKGMKQRLGLAQALLAQPRVLFLDEPTDGVDPVGRRHIRDLLLEERAKGVTLFVNSHLLSEMEQLCDRVAILKNGRIALTGTVADLTRQGDRWQLELASGESWPATLNLAAQEIGPSRYELVLAKDGDIDDVLRGLIGSGVKLRHLERMRSTLEDLYLDVAGGGGA
jgi:ABC-2 type transport system ATP-binding protein